MTLRHLKIFVTVCDTLNMTAAAELLYMTQPAVSQAIAELEEHYEVKLFERLSRKLFLTAAGRELMGYARHMIRMSTEAERAMKSLKTEGILRVGASVTLGGYVLPGLVRRFQCDNPSAEITVVENNTEIIEHMAIRDEIDFGLVEGEVTSSELLAYPFMEDELVIVCPLDHKFARGGLIEPGELEGEPFIIREPGSGTRKTFENAMAGCRVAWKAAWTCNNTDTIKMAVAGGIGIAALSRLAVQNEIAAGMLCEVAVRGMKFDRRFRVIYHKNKYLTEAMKKFISLCSAERELHKNHPT